MCALVTSLDMVEQAAGASAPPELSMGDLDGLASLQCQHYDRGCQQTDLHIICLEYVTCLSGYLNHTSQGQVMPDF